MGQNPLIFCNNLNLTKVMGSTTEGDAVGQAEGRASSMGGWAVQYLASRPSSNSAHGEIWREHCVGGEEEFPDIKKSVAWTFLVG
jgi:hypothetical protein